MARAYRLKRRAERQDETRQRIVDATIELHQTVGRRARPSARSRERARVGQGDRLPPLPGRAHAVAGLQRALPRATTRSPIPTAWSAIADPVERLRAALRETYAYHRANEAMFARALADVRDHPVMEPYHGHWRRAADVLVHAWQVRGRQRTMLRAGIALALSFDTWRTLALDQGLTDEQAVDLMLRLSCECDAERG